MLLTRPFILLIDDDHDDTEMMLQLFSELSIESQNCVSGDHAFEFLDGMVQNSILPTLVILDYNLPGNNGLEILAGMKSNPDTREIPVIMYSTSISAMLQKKLMDNGAYACYVKPCTYPEARVHTKIFAKLAAHFSLINEKKKYLFH